MTILYRIVLWLVLALPLGLSAQRSLSLIDYIQTCPLLDEAQREQTAQALSRQGNQSTSCTVVTSPVSLVTIKLLPLLNGTPLILVLERVTSPTLDTQLRAYSPKWEELTELKLLDRVPTRELLLERWPREAGSYEDERLSQLLYPLHLEMQWASGEGIRLSVKPVLPLSLSDREHPGLMELVAAQPELVYEWRGSRLELLQAATTLVDKQQTIPTK